MQFTERLFQVSLWQWLTSDAHNWTVSRQSSFYKQSYGTEELLAVSQEVINLSVYHLSVLVLSVSAVFFFHQLDIQQ